MTQNKHGQNLLEQYAEKWRLCEGLPESDLLRLVVLRELLQSLHAEKSRLLSSGKRDESTSIRALETRIEELRNAKPLEGNLTALLSANAKFKKRSRLLPSTVFGAVERENSNALIASGKPPSPLKPSAWAGESGPSRTGSKSHASKSGIASSSISFGRMESSFSSKARARTRK